MPCKEKKSNIMRLTFNSHMFIKRYTVMYHRLSSDIWYFGIWVIKFIDTIFSIGLVDLLWSWGLISKEGQCGPVWYCNINPSLRSATLWVCLKVDHINFEHGNVKTVSWIDLMHWLQLALVVATAFSVFWVLNFNELTLHVRVCALRKKPEREDSWTWN